jgi:hypothetical protein
VKHFFVDYLGIALRASSLDSGKPARALTRELMIPGQATLLGLGVLSGLQGWLEAGGLVESSGGRNSGSSRQTRPIWARSDW